MRSFEHEQHIDAPPATVWALTIDVEAWPALFPTITRVERLDHEPMRVGSQARIRQPAQPERLWTVTELLEGRRFVWSTQARGFTMTGVHIVEPDPTGGTVNRLRLEVDGPLALLVAALAGRKLRQTLAIENAGFASAAARARARSAT